MTDFDFDADMAKFLVQVTGRNLLKSNIILDHFLTLDILMAHGLKNLCRIQSIQMMG